MQGEKLVSVIVAAYNIEQYLPRCLDSLLAQTCKSLEIVLIDDGSTDRTPEICDKYAKENESIKVVHRENGGLSAARNLGVRVAKGDFIGFVDGDDWVEPQMYEEMLKACLLEDAQIAICNYRQIGEGAEQTEATGEKLVLPMEKAVEMFVYGDSRYRISNAVWCKLFKRSIIKDIRFVEGKSSEDIIYTTWALTKASKSVFLDVPYYNYVVDRSDSIMNIRLEERRFKDEIPFWKEQISYLYGLGLVELAEKASYRFYRRLLNYYLDFRDRGMKEAGRRLMSLLKNERGEVIRIYKKEFVPVGDKVRMKVAFVTPGGYYQIVKLYDKFIIPLRQKGRKQKLQ